MKWASAAVVALLLAGCANSQQAVQERPNTTGTTRNQAKTTRTQHESLSFIATLQQWVEEVSLSIRSAVAVRACRETLVAAAEPYRATRVEAAAAGPARWASQGIMTVPIDARVTYARGQVSEVKQGRVTCWLNNRGIVTELKGRDDRVRTAGATTLSD